MTLTVSYNPDGDIVSVELEDGFLTPNQVRALRPAINECLPADQVLSHAAIDDWEARLFALYGANLGEPA